ncbi:unnamed protein product [Musa acuminata subsp. burmannicoides]
MYEYEMCSSTFETRVLCHVKKSSYQPISGGKFMKSVESTFTEAATETLTGGSSFVGQKRNRENLLLSSAAPRSHAGVGCTFQRSIPVRPLTTSDRGGATALIGSVVTTLESHLLHRLRGTERSRVPAATPSSTDVGGGDVGITAEELEAFDLGKLRRSSKHSWLRLRRRSILAVTSTAPTILSLPEVDALLTSDATDTVSTTIPKASPSGHVDVLLMPDDTRIDSTTVAEASSSIDFVV